MRALIARLVPFFMLGVALVALFFGLVLLAYLFFFGAVVGLILFLISWIRSRFSSKKPSGGRLIDHDKQK